MASNVPGIGILAPDSETELDALDTDERRALAADELNQKIIERLQEDGRASYATIARELGTSESTVRYRVSQLMRMKIIKVLAVADPVALGNEGYAMVGLKLASGADPREVSKRFQESDEVTYVLFVAGTYDLLVEVITRDHNSLRKFLLDNCYGSPDIAEVEPMLALAMYKNLLKWGRP